jgi:hypothetical protein
MVLDPHFREFLTLLNANDVRYLVVGGYAVAFHGYPRYAKNLDIWIDLASDNAVRVTDALRDFGFEEGTLESADFLDPNYVIRLGEPPERIDMRTALEGVTFTDCYADRVSITLDGVTIPFIDLENLRRNKQAAGRYQDLADLENLS